MALPHFMKHSLARQVLAECATWEGSRVFDRGSIAMGQMYLDITLDVFAGLQSSKSWSRLRWKRLIDPHLRSMLYPKIQGLRNHVPEEALTS
jgi:hypothetical protein